MCESLEILRETVVKDYFTPNIKAEVILDTLLTPYVPQILRNECGIDADFLTKEMSLEKFEENDRRSKNNRGSKIDYILTDKEYVYLVELKTTAGSIKRDQAVRYIRSCCDETCMPRTFERVFGGKLLRILSDYYTLSRKDGSGDSWNLGNLPAVFDNVVGKGTKKDHALRARNYLRQANKSSTYKYLHTMGEILDYCSDPAGPKTLEYKLKELWNREVRLIYITPHSKKTRKELLEYRDFYIHPDDTESICLERAVKGLKACCSGDEPYVQMLKDVVMEIYEGGK